MPLPDRMKRRFEEEWETMPPNRRKVISDFEAEYNKAVADKDWPTVDRLEALFDEALKNVEKIRLRLGLGRSDPFDVKT